MASSNQGQIEVLDEYKKVEEMIHNKTPVIFVTGGGGTGKSTFIRYINNRFAGKVLKAAPTGIAALNIEGKTVHSLFRMAPKLITADDIEVLPAHQIKIYHNADIVIIDEISMVTSNMLDAINIFLQKNLRSKKPFGGKTVIMVGDMFQLPPIVGNNVSEVYYKMYDTAYFFGANVMQEVNFEFIELNKVRRQNDEVFIDILSNIRVGKNVAESLAVINERCNIQAEPEDGAVVLSPRNSEVDTRNNTELRRIRGVEEFSYTGIISGKFKSDRLPSPIFLDLKVGAQVQFTQNNPEWNVVNGTIAKVVDLHNDYVVVKLLDTGEKVTVKRVFWEEYDYKYNDYKKSVESIVSGTYEQIPLKLAWASTIHKCVSKDTKVSTPKGKFKISDIEIGDKVYSGFNICTVLNKWNSGMKTAYKIKLKGDIELVCSEDHKILAYKNYDNPDYVELKNLTYEYKVATSLYNYKGCDKWYEDFELQTLNKPKLDFDFGYIIGILLGDGCYTNNNSNDYRISLHKPKIQILKKFEEFLNKLGLENYKYRAKDKSTNYDEIYVINKELKLFLHNIGLTMSKSNYKFISENFLNSNREFRKGVLSGLIDTDGSVETKKIVFTSSSSELLDTYIQLLKSFSIYGYKDKTNLQVFVTSNNSIDLCKILQCYNPDRLEYINLTKELNYSKSNNDLVKFVKNGKKYKKVSTTRHLNLNSDNKFISKDIYYTDIISIEKVDDVEMYDIEVSDDHSFIGNDIIVHNCQGVSLDKVHLDLGAGCFATGQLYVALSRCRTLNGITITRKIEVEDVQVDHSIVSFYEDCRAGKQDFKKSEMDNLIG